MRFDEFFGCVFWPKKAKKGQNVMDIVMQVWVYKSVRVCYTLMSIQPSGAVIATAAAVAAAAAAAQQRH